MPKVRKIDGGTSSGRDGHDEAEDALVAFDELVRARPRLAGLAPLSRRELDAATVALHEAVMHFLSRRQGAPAGPSAGNAADRLLKAARNRSTYAFTVLVAALAIKVSGSRTAETPNLMIEELTDYLDGIAFDVRATRRATLARLKRVRIEVDARIRHVRESPPAAFQFVAQPELYGGRADKTETPEKFFKRVYGPEVRRGMTQADLRRVDPAFYNVLHVWCSRNKRLISRLVPASRRRTK